MLDPESSLILEVYGLKVTALGVYPVSALTLFMVVAVLALAVVRPTQVFDWIKRLGKSRDK